MNLMSWPLLGPHVVGVFSYGAGNGSEESEQCCHPGDKRQRGPGSRAKEALGSAPGPRGPRGAPLNSQVFEQEGLCGNVAAFFGMDQIRGYSQVLVCWSKIECLMMDDEFWLNHGEFMSEIHSVFVPIICHTYYLYTWWKCCVSLSVLVKPTRKANIQKRDRALSLHF